MLSPLECADIEDAPNYQEVVAMRTRSPAGPRPLMRRRLAAAPAASEASARHEAEQQDYDGRAEKRRENRDARQRQLRGDHEGPSSDPQPSTDQPGHDRTRQPPGHAAADPSFPPESA